MWYGVSDVFVDIENLCDIKDVFWGVLYKLGLKGRSNRYIVNFIYILIFFVFVLYVSFNCFVIN